MSEEGDERFLSRAPVLSGGSQLYLLYATKEIASYIHIHMYICICVYIHIYTYAHKKVALDKDE
mgnify:CR=1 FL=1